VSRRPWKRSALPKKTKATFPARAGPPKPEERERERKRRRRNLIEV
jgi:hypothetical protein